MTTRVELRPSGQLGAAVPTWLSGMSGGPEACSFGSFSYLNFAVPNAPLAAWWMAANASFLMAVFARYVLPALVATAGIGYFGRTD